MSYILDALKKSDQERQQGTSPGLYSAHGPIPYGIKTASLFSRHRILWLFIIGLVLSLACSMLIFIRSRQTVADSPSVIEKAPPFPAEAETTKMRQPEQPSGQLNPTTVTMQPEIIIKEKDRVIKTVAIEDRSTEPPVVINQEDPGDPETSPPLLQELSAALKAEIPSLKFAGHTYALEPYQRLIIINGKILREGDTISPGLRLLEITWNGVTIDFKGTRFRVDTE